METPYTSVTVPDHKLMSDAPANVNVSAPGVTVTVNTTTGATHVEAPYANVTYSNVTAHDRKLLSDAPANVDVRAPGVIVSVNQSSGGTHVEAPYTNVTFNLGSGSSSEGGRRNRTGNVIVRAQYASVRAQSMHLESIIPE